MSFAIALAGLHLAVLALAGFDPGAAPAAFALSQGAFALAALALPDARRALLDTVITFWPGIVLFVAVIAIAAWHAGLLGASGDAFKPFEARRETLSLIGLLLGGLAAAAAAGAAGRRAVQETLLISSLVFAVLDIAHRFQAGPDHPLLAAPGQAAAVYGLFTVLAAFTAFDELRSRADSAGMLRRGPPLQRAMLPGAALAACITGAALSGAPVTAAATATGIAVLFACLALRDRGPIVMFLSGAAALALAAAVVLVLAFATTSDRFGWAEFQMGIATALKGAAGLGSGAAGGPLQTWPVEVGALGAGALALAALAWAVRLGLASDRRRAPSRGLGLGLGCLTLVAFAGPTGTNDAVAATLALLCGLASSYADRLRRDPQRRRAAPAPAAPEPDLEPADNL
ncbi:MAG: hypothetical protein AB7M12_12435 [Hyphomonadaceae bacterium]